MKPLRPTMREKRRYIHISKGENELEKAILDFSGVLGLSKVGLKSVKRGIFSINRESLDLVRASVAVWPNDIEIKKISGTLKSLEKR